MTANAYHIQYAQAAADDIKALRAYDQRKIVDAIEEHLGSAPTQISRSRIKAMQQPFWSQYRLRVDNFRVYYDVDESQHVVSIVRVLEKGQGQTPGKEAHETD
jgi:mRNA interferase RelE/StbE